MELDADLACNLAWKLRRLHGKAAAGPQVAASNDVDGGMDSALRASNDDGVRADIDGLIAPLNVDERRELAGLVILGRDAQTYDDLEAAGRAFDDLGADLDLVILDDPLAADFLLKGLERIGVICAERSDAAGARVTS